MPADNFSLIAGAIQDRRPIVATYNGHQRWLCPHVLGSKGGRAQCLFYQFGGTDERGLSWDGSPKNWRCIPVDDLEDLSEVDGPWHTADNYAPYEQTCVDGVIFLA
jgi:hypothetical protein